MEPLGRDREGAGFMSRLEVGEFLAFFSIEPDRISRQTTQSLGPLSPKP